jgi:hypothetical protein
MWKDGGSFSHVSPPCGGGPLDSSRPRRAFAQDAPPSRCGGR